ncbi:hypothetical protein [Paraburkholderia terrae]|uniref:Uncharacterized protein n=1 Tax=Paraburkholderia terrae TaxID=311230 RepID=A0ABM7U2J8_9BURK|nr:hypothetical protein [Paraburkholderia terrae]BCZ85203.1 hypothetical protein PTKU64_88780 [Paraburkholderia terrae]BCZ85279.1 hypothetical protein PTKU64_89540 [Paraburkholderia terrae]BDC45582.1 hypothetical protein PTKU15_88790 [Paraburkholderia terrae]
MSTKKSDGNPVGLQDILQALPPRSDVNAAREQLRERLATVTADNVEECRALYEWLEQMRLRLRLTKWSSLQAYYGPIPRCVKAVGGKGR